MNLYSSAEILQWHPNALQIKCKLLPWPTRSWLTHVSCPAPSSVTLPLAHCDPVALDSPIQGMHTFLSHLTRALLPGVLSPYFPMGGLLHCLSALSHFLRVALSKWSPSCMFLITAPCFHFPLVSYTICSSTFNYVLFVYCLTLQLNRKHHTGKDNVCSLAFVSPALGSGSAPSVWSRDVGWMSLTLCFFHPSKLSSNCPCALFGDSLTPCLGSYGFFCPEHPPELPQMLKWHSIWGSVGKPSPPRGVLIFSQSHHQLLCVLLAKLFNWTSLVLRSPTAHCELR